MKLVGQKGWEKLVREMDKILAKHNPVALNDDKNLAYNLYLGIRDKFRQPEFYA